MLQIIASYTLASRETKLDNLTPAENALVVFSKILPFLANDKVGRKGPDGDTPESARAIAEISSLLIAFSEVVNDNTLALATVEKLKEFTGVRPSLLRTQELWSAQRERDGITSSFFNGENGQEVDEDGPLSFLPCQTNDGCNIL